MILCLPAASESFLCGRYREICDYKTKAPSRDPLRHAMAGKARLVKVPPQDIASTNSRGAGVDQVAANDSGGNTKIMETM